MFEKIRMGMAIAKNYTSIKDKYNAAAISVGGLAAMIVVVLVVIVIAVSLLQPLFSAVNTATSNTTLTSNSHYTAAFDLVYLIPLVFAAGIVVLVVALMFEKIKGE
jgi:hypothetical protein